MGNHAQQMGWNWRAARPGSRSARRSPARHVQPVLVPGVKKRDWRRAAVPGGELHRDPCPGLSRRTGGRTLTSPTGDVLPVADAQPAARGHRRRGATPDGAPGSPVVMAWSRSASSAGETGHEGPKPARSKFTTARATGAGDAAQSGRRDRCRVEFLQAAGFHRRAPDASDAGSGATFVSTPITATRRRPRRRSRSARRRAGSLRRTGTGDQPQVVSHY